MIDESIFDVWLSTRLVDNVNILGNTSYGKHGNLYYAEFRVKNASAMSKYFDNFKKKNIELKVLVNDLYE